MISAAQACAAEETEHADAQSQLPTLEAAVLLEAVKFLCSSILTRSLTLRKLRSSLIIGATLIMPSPLHIDRDNIGLFAAVCEVSLKPWQSSGFSLIARAELSGSAWYAVHFSIVSRAREPTTAWRR